MASAFNTHNFNRERPLGEVLNDLKIELKDFISTRLQMLRSEMSDKLGAIKVGAPSMIVGGVLAGTAFVLFTLAFVFLISMAFEGQPWAYALSFAIVAVIYAIAGTVALSYGWNTIKARGIAPERTMRVLKQDQIWIETEAMTQL